MKIMEVVCKEFDYRTDLDTQRELFSDCFPENIGTQVVEKEHYLWKFQSFPTNSTSKSFETIATIDDDMAGYYAAIPYTYMIAGKEHQIGMVCDVMTSSKYRGKGIFTKLGKFSLSAMEEKGVSLTMGYPIRKEVLPGHLKVGWKVAFKQPLYMRFLSVRSLLKGKGVGFLSYLVDPFLFVYSVFTKSNSSKDYIIKVFDRVEDVTGYDDLVKNWRFTLPNSLDKSLPFAKWRYGAPDKKYIFIGAYKNDELVGFSSFREVVKEGVPSLGILDFMTLPLYRQCLANVHNEILRLAKQMNKEAIMTMMSPTYASYYKLIGNGFLRSPFIFNIIINKFDTTIEDAVLYNEKNWHLMFVDSDDL